MFIQTEATPNPATLKFLPGRDVLVGEPRDFRSPEASVNSPLAQGLFSISGVTGVFLGSDFISVTKDITEWNHIKPAILGVIMEHFLSGKPVIADGTLAVDTEEGDPLAVLQRLALEVGELLAARPAPRRPLVDDHRVALQLGEARLEGDGAAVEQLVGLGVDGGERGRRAGERGPRGLLRRRLALGGVAPAAHGDGRECDETEKKWKESGHPVL